MPTSSTETKERSQLSANTHIVVKFHDNIAPLDVNNVEQSIRQNGLGPWDELKQRFPEITIVPALAKVWDRVDHHVQLAKVRTPTYSPPNFKAFCNIRIIPSTDAQSLIAELKKWSTVEYAYLTRPPVVAGVNAGPNPCEQFQQYHQPATVGTNLPVGIDALYAWQVPGGDGAGQTFADIEPCWMVVAPLSQPSSTALPWVGMVTHEDLPQNVALAPGVGGMGPPGSIQNGVFNPTSVIDHGTGVLGIICGADNEIDGVGIVPNIQQGYLIPQQPPEYDVAEAIFQSLNFLQAGNVLLLEVALPLLPGGDGPDIPAECDPKILAAIQLAVQSGIVVIEPAGNLGFPLDRWMDQSGNFRLNRQDPNFEDSGAIMVGAAVCWGGQLQAIYNFGTRVDCYAWGDWVWTLKSYDPSTQPIAPCDWQSQSPRQQVFGGTSAASAIITAVALSVQGMSQQLTQSPMSPGDLRTLLSSDIYGTPSANGAADGIGVMPNLRNIAQLHFNVTI